MARAWLPLCCVLLHLVSVTTGRQAAHPGWAVTLAGLVAVAAGLLLLWREHAPIAVMTGAVIGYLLQALLVAPPIPAAVVVMAVVVARRATQAESGLPAWQAMLALIGALVGVGAGAVAGGSAFLAAGYGLVLLAATLVGVLLSLRATRAAAQDRELILRERLRIARDLHDVVGHGIGGITVQAGAARMALAAGAEEDALRALRQVEASGREVLREVRWLVGLLREDGGAADEHDLAALIGNARRCGLDVTLEVSGDLPTAPATTAEAAYRIVQEALTNVLRHAGGCAVTVRVRMADVLQLDVLDEGSGSLDHVATGNGIRGMRERAAAVGGTVDAGPRPAGAGWAVRATLPLAGRSR